MQSNYFLAMKSERAALIRTRLEKLQTETAQAYSEISTTLAKHYRIGHETPIMRTFQSAKEQIETQLLNIWFRLSLVTEPECKFCGSTWGLSPEIDLRYGVTFQQAARAGCFWCCGSCYAHVLNAAYSNLPEMRPVSSHEWTPEEVSSHDRWLSSQS